MGAKFQGAKENPKKNLDLGNRKDRRIVPANGGNPPKRANNRIVKTRRMCYFPNRREKG
jgi:hypothetical protein